ncbi:bestrophin family ion channel [uncultured Sphingomonas sp.]|uniref:bestrophin family protein n=1 Tax=uncultured Sphingomonas sp. TaxID=158754 RepID=UPI00258ECF2F|nr:bestrophin family ion channel [uncultured Sphingomonas sp.]
MIVGRAPRIRHTLYPAWRTLAVLFVWDSAVTLFYYALPFSAPALPVTLFGTVLGLFLGFRTNSAYQRWWEARTLWGAMINASRSLSRAIMAFVPDDRASAASMKRLIVRRQIAYVHALRCQLRRQDPAPEIVRLLGEDAATEALARTNPANALLDGSSRMIADIRREGLIDTIQQTQIEHVMVDIANAQGGMERLKNTPLPAQYRSFPVFFTKLLCLLLPIGLVDTLEWATPIGSSLAGFMFLAGLQVADDLVDPFANTVHDVPLTAMCRTIEIDLLQSAGYDAPPPLQPDGHVLW